MELTGPLRSVPSIIYADITSPSLKKPLFQTFRQPFVAAGSSPKQFRIQSKVLKGAGPMIRDSTECEKASLAAAVSRLLQSNRRAAAFRSANLHNRRYPCSSGTFSPPPTPATAGVAARPTIPVFNQHLIVRFSLAPASDLSASATPLRSASSTCSCADPRFDEKRSIGYP